MFLSQYREGNVDSNGMNVDCSTLHGPHQKRTRGICGLCRMTCIAIKQLQGDLRRAKRHTLHIKDANMAAATLNDAGGPLKNNLFLLSLQICQA